ncbi:MAG: ATP-binding cassette domain-containing protein [Thermotogaceae bacterium]|nr:ATP-binding cassette domain-containing protein [Thermotogota bacterium]NLZ13825.1 ATP-binding cassette domain-containing protein [Thermotogaceae bacterium]HPB87672.1 ATP-binding cassette domain-containing protein [Thermotogota bacterium]
MIAFDKVCFTYDIGSPLRRDIFQDLSFTLEKGRPYFVIGKNGTGKSTLLQLCNALLIPQSGTVAIDGMLTSDRKALPEIRKRVGILFQYPERFFFGPKVRDELCFPLKNWKIPFEGWESKIQNALSLTGLSPSILDRSPFTLSGGEMRLVAIAALLVTNPTTVLLDEPTVGLDHHGRRRVQHMIRDYLRIGSTILLVTHEMQLAFDLDDSNRMFLMLERNRAPLKMTMAELLAAEGLEETYGLRFPSMIEYERIKNRWKRSPES